MWNVIEQVWVLWKWSWWLMAYLRVKMNFYLQYPCFSSSLLEVWYSSSTKCHWVVTRCLKISAAKVMLYCHQTTLVYIFIWWIQFAMRDVRKMYWVVVSFMKIMHWKPHVRASVKLYPCLPNLLSYLCKIWYKRSHCAVECLWVL
jgi:hypothetical protein